MHQQTQQPPAVDYSQDSESYFIPLVATLAAAGPLTWLGSRNGLVRFAAWACTVVSAVLLGLLYWNPSNN